MQPTADSISGVGQLDAGQQGERQRDAARRFWLFYAAVFLFLCVLCYLFPYSGDDWAWGSQYGLERLTSFFAEYNGRYSGNLLIIALSRLRPLRAVVEAAFCTGIIAAVVCLSDGDKRNAAALSSFLFFTCGRLLFRQSLAWAAGFSNYVPPILFILLYLCCCKAVCRPVGQIKTALPPLLNVLVCAGMLVMSFIGAMFIEHMTIYAIAVAAAVLVIEKTKCRRVYAFSVFYLIGALAGAACMFANGAYDNVADGTDIYRTMAEGAGMTERVLKNAITIFTETAKNNLVLNTVTTLLLAVLAYKLLRSGLGKWEARIVRLLLAYNIAFLLYTYFAAVYPKWRVVLGYTSRFDVLASFFYLLSTFLLSLLCLEDRQRKLKILFCYASIGVFTAPLFFVTPIGSRCFFAAFVFQIIVACLISEEALPGFEKSPASGAFIRRALGVGVIVACLFWSSIFGYVFETELRRNRYVTEQLSEGRGIIKVIALPYADFMWNANPSDAPVWIIRYKEYWGIDESKYVKVINLNDYLYEHFYFGH